MAIQNSAGKIYLSPACIALVMAVQLLAFWRAWQWYINRVWESPEEAVALLILLAVLAGKGLRNTRISTGALLPWWWLIASCILYTLATLLSMPMLLRAVIAVLSVGATLYVLAFCGEDDRNTQQGYRAGFWALLILCMPLVPTLQFYLGYPARMISAAATVVLLNANGYGVVQEGTFLRWQNELIQFDAPCSGVTMLWAAWLISCVFALLQKLNAFKTGVMMALATVVTLLGNSFRAASLFYLEAGALFKASPWMHEAVGLVVFVAIVAALHWISMGLATGSWKVAT